MCNGHTPTVTWGFLLPYFLSASKAFSSISRRGTLFQLVRWLLALSSVETQRRRFMWKFTLSLAHRLGQIQLAPALHRETSRCSQILHKGSLYDTFPTMLRQNVSAVPRLSAGVGTRLVFDGVLYTVHTVHFLWEEMYFRVLLWWQIVGICAYCRVCFQGISVLNNSLCSWAQKHEIELTPILTAGFISLGAGFWMLMLPDL